MTYTTRKRILTYMLLVPSVILLVLPVFWLILLSFRPDRVVQSGLTSILSTEFTLGHYATLLRQYRIPLYLFNSMVVSLVPAIIAVVAALLGGYAVVRLNFWGSRLFHSLPLFAQVVPSIQILIPMYAIMLMLGLLNTYLAVILAHTALVLPLAIWMMTGYLQSVPVEMEEAAMIDGCSRVGAIFRVVVPVAMPGIVATGLIAFLSSWGEFVFAFTLTSSETMRVMAVTVYQFIPGGMSPVTWGLLFAMATMFMVPTLLLFALLQSFLRQGLSLGATTGT